MASFGGPIAKKAEKPNSPAGSRRSSLNSVSSLEKETNLLEKGIINIYVYIHTYIHKCI